ncbi:sensor histidine kinase [Limnoglobus roseus]|uniref:histidine kinase n=1 Tax=Limnoglobus roseus TaxID=2598579 RepID=A0A5C1AEP6_9BACT|nr:sensor histidine kinase [Limnoglobus roseus]QEL15508.1 sensor histidine kinase [Limnoglobus roseus]
MTHRPLSESTFQAIALPARRAVWKYVGGLAPVVIIWAVLVGWLSWLLHERASWSEESDRAAVREWIDESRNFRKTLPELVKEYAHARADDPTGVGDPRRQETKRAEVLEHMRSLVEPTRAYVNQLPLFPEIYRLEVVLAPPPGSPKPEPDALTWLSAVPKPIRQSRDSLRVLEYRPFNDDRAVIRCEYRLHAFNKLERLEQERQQMSLIAGMLLLTATALAILFVTRFLRREHRRELDRLTTVAEIEHQELELLQAQRRQDEAARIQQQLHAQLLGKQLETSDLQRRAAEAEKMTLEMKSQLYASIGIMAGSYAHNIKNLLVRPNDLLSRCIEVNGLSPDQEGMLHEVKSTLGTVTERLQQILKTVRRDPANAEVTKLDLAALVGDSAKTWTDMGRDKWKLKITADVPAEPVVITGDVSHLQQAIENLLFNARDATFEMRNFLREEARHATDRKQALLAAAGWKGEIHLTVRREADRIVLDVRDNGIGMTEVTRQKCLQPHYTTKRDNALYEGYSAGMGLGLSFVAMVLDHHHATVGIESEVRKGTTFRVVFPAE